MSRNICKFFFLGRSMSSSSASSSLSLLLESVPRFKVQLLKSKNINWMIHTFFFLCCSLNWVKICSWVLQVLGQTSSEEDDFGKFYFYLAFENSICNDYVTEKFFRGLQVIIANLDGPWENQDSQAPVVPIVLGGANYSALAPNHSFIHVDDFNRYIVHSLVQNLKPYILRVILAWQLE